MKPTTILALGNSLTAGFGVTAEQAYPALLQHKLRAAGYSCNVINAGISGETSGGALSRLNGALSLDPDIVILETGVNDLLFGSAARSEANIRRIVQRLKEKDVAVILAGMRSLWDASPNTPFARLYPSIACEEGVSLIPFFLEGVAGHPDLNQADGVHPTAAGYKIVAETVYPYAVSVLQEVSRR